MSTTETISSSLPITVDSDLKAAEQALREEVIQAARSLHGLTAHQDQLGTEATANINAAVEEVRDRLDRKGLSVVVVGEKKAGKSTFLNAILGSRVLGTAVRECTGTVTFIQWGDRPMYQAAMKSGETICFQDLEATERSRIEGAILEMRKKLAAIGTKPDEVIPGTDLPVWYEGIQTVHKEACAKVRDAEEAVGIAEAKVKETSAEKLRNSSLAHALSGQVATAEAEIDASRKQLVEFEADLKKKRQSIRDLYDRVEDIDPADLGEARLRLEQALLKRSAAVEGLPSLLRPDQFVLIRWFCLFLFGWAFRRRLKSYRDADSACHRARLQAEALETASQIVSARARLADEEEGLEALQRSLETAKRNIAELCRTLDVAEIDLANCRAEFKNAGIEEDIATLNLVQAYGVMLEAAARARFCSEIHDLTDMNKRGSEVVELRIYYPAIHLPKGITIIDTPGVNTDNDDNRDRAWAVIRKEADGCLLLSDLQQVVSQSTRNFLQDVREFIPHILLVMTKVDLALANADEVGGEDPWVQVEEARRIGVKRFAKEIGRSAQDVFSIAVAAEAALQGDGRSMGLSDRFSNEVTKVFRLLQSERAVVLGARAAAGLRYCLQQIQNAQINAEAGYKRRIADLELHKLPDPAAFQQKQIARIEEELQRHSEAVTTHARHLMATGVDQLEAQWVKAIMGCPTKDAVKAMVAQLGQQGPNAMSQIMAKVSQGVKTESGKVIKLLEEPLLAELKEKYRIVQQLTASGKTAHTTSLGIVHATGHAKSIHASVGEAIATFEMDQLKIGAGGALAGAAIGTLFLPGIGTAIGAAIGALAGLFKTLDSLKQDCVREVRTGLGNAKRGLNDQLAPLSADLQRQIRKSLSEGLANAVQKFQAYIDELMEEERKAIALEKEKLDHLVRNGEALASHDQRLRELQTKAALVSQGLCA